MITWRLWQAVHNPPANNRLFQQLFTVQKTTHGLGRTVRILVLYLSACSVMTLIWPLLVANTPTVIIIMIAVANTIYGATWATRISAAIAREREIGTYELLCLLPFGEPGAAWALSTVEFYRSTLFRIVSLIVQVLTAGGIGAILLAMFIPIVMLASPGHHTDVIFSLSLVLTYGLTLVLGLYFDHIQAVMIAHLMGMLMPIQTQSRLNAQLWAVGMYLLVQTLAYLTASILAFVILTRLFDRPDNAILALGLPILRLGIFYVVREVAIMSTWHILVSSLDVKADQFGQVMR